jgi:hypothetical protein
MILQFIGGRASEVYVNHLPRIFMDVAEGMGEDRGVILDDDKLAEICAALQMKPLGNWGYKKLPNRLYFGFGPHFAPEEFKIVLKEDVLEPPLDEFEPAVFDVRRTRALPDRSAMDESIEDGVVVIVRTLFSNKDFWVDLGDAGGMFDPSLLSIQVHDLGDMLRNRGLSIVHHLVYEDRILEFGEGYGDEIDYEILLFEPERFIT